MSAKWDAYWQRARVARERRLAEPAVEPSFEEKLDAMLASGDLADEVQRENARERVAEAERTQAEQEALDAARERRG